MNRMDAFGELISELTNLEAFINESGDRAFTNPDFKEKRKRCYNPIFLFVYLAQTSRLFIEWIFRNSCSSYNESIDTDSERSGRYETTEKPGFRKSRVTTVQDAIAWQVL